jgi:hypothetical protein
MLLVLRVGTPVVLRQLRESLGRFNGRIAARSLPPGSGLAWEVDLIHAHALRTVEIGFVLVKVRGHVVVCRGAAGVFNDTARQFVRQDGLDGLPHFRVLVEPTLNSFIREQLDSNQLLKGGLPPLGRVPGSNLLLHPSQDGVSGDGLRGSHASDDLSRRRSFASSTAARKEANLKRRECDPPTTVFHASPQGPSCRSDEAVQDLKRLPRQVS